MEKASCKSLPLLTHRFELRDEFFFGPFFLVSPKCYVGSDYQLVVIRIRNIQIMNQHNVRILYIIKQKKHCLITISFFLSFLHFSFFYFFFCLSLQTKESSEEKAKTIEKTKIGIISFKGI